MAELTKKLEKDIYKAVLNGAISNSQVAECVGLTVDQYNNMKYNNHPVKNQQVREKREKDSTKIHIIIKEAEEERRSRRVKAARDGIMQLVAPTPYVDKTVEVKETKRPDGKIERETKTKEVTKNFAPNVTACIFELCNSDKENYQSINKASIELGEDSKGLIAKYFDDMEKRDERKYK